MIEKFVRGPIKKGEHSGDYLNISFSKKKVKGSFRVFYFMDHQHHIAYMPTLQLTGYGDTREEALEMLFDEVLDDFWENVIEHPEQLDKILRDLGWKRDKIFNKKFIADSYIDKEGILKNFNLPAETPIESEVLTAA